MMTELPERIQKLSAGLRHLARVFTAEQLHPDPATGRFCLEQLRRLASVDELEAKVAGELAHGPWEPLGRLLIIISENDALGTLQGFAAAYLTGNAMRVKAALSAPLLLALRDVLGLPPDQCDIASWSGRDTADEDLLGDADAVLAAGSDALIRRVRSLAPSRIRLVEFGPKLSVAAVGHNDGNDAALAGCVDALLRDVSLFRQDVCSSPGFIMADETVAEKLAARLEERLPSLPALPQHDRLRQYAKGEELKLRHKLRLSGRVVLHPGNGWGLTVSRGITPDLWLPKGFQICVGPLDELFSAARALWPGQLQTLGVAGTVPPATGFSRICPLGSMHERPLTAPHDGLFELSALVKFVSDECDASALSRPGRVS